MHGLINRSIERFIRDCYGEQLWQNIARETGVSRFESMLHYDDHLTEKLIILASKALAKPPVMVLEDVGASLAQYEALRRLLRFGGTDFSEFLLSLNELHGRGRLALPDLELPEIRVADCGEGLFELVISARYDGWASVLTGLLRAMGDDYGALVLLGEPTEELCLDATAKGSARLTVEVVQARYARGRRFRLSEAI